MPKLDTMRKLLSVPVITNTKVHLLNDMASIYHHKITHKLTFFHFQEMQADKTTGTFHTVFFWHLLHWENIILSNTYLHFFCFLEYSSSNATCATPPYQRSYYKQPFVGPKWAFNQTKHWFLWREMWKLAENHLKTLNLKGRSVHVFVSLYVQQRTQNVSEVTQETSSK